MHHLIHLTFGSRVWYSGTPCRHDKVSEGSCASSARQFLIYSTLLLVWQIAEVVVGSCT